MPCAVEHWACVRREHEVPLGVVTQHGARNAQMSLPHSVPAPFHEPAHPACVVIVQDTVTVPGTVAQQAPLGDETTHELFGPQTVPRPKNCPEHALALETMMHDCAPAGLVTQQAPPEIVWACAGEVSAPRLHSAAALTLAANRMRDERNMSKAS